MRNSKVKGFTLIELIVVIAIIGILAAILVPSMLGYVRNARISQANANAKQVHTAVSSALTQLGISNINLKGNNNNTINPVDYFVDVAKADGGAIDVKFNKTSPDNAKDKMDLVSYLGDNFNGVGRAYFNPSTYSVNVAIFAASTADTEKAATAVASNALITKAAGYMSNDNGTLKNAAGELQQKTDAKNGSLYGVYPQGTDATTT